MKQYVTDTHPFIWFVTENKRLSRRARVAFQRADDGWEQIAVPITWTLRY
ncbi:MAG: type II toxin-antitoxin system VapC family toxin [Chloroflexi bacterium]|nr:type II toxin-antitoxin system VapC family toxin [Chloroflexota bacterium]